MAASNGVWSSEISGIFSEIFRVGNFFGSFSSIVSSSWLPRLHNNLCSAALQCVCDGFIKLSRSRPRPRSSDRSVCFVFRSCCKRTHANVESAASSQHVQFILCRQQYEFPLFVNDFIVLVLVSDAFVWFQRPDDVDYSMTQPLFADGSNFPCKSYPAGPVSLTARAGLCSSGLDFACE